MFEDNSRYLTSKKSGYDLAKWAEKKGYSLTPKKGLAIIGEAQLTGRTPYIKGQGGTRLGSRFIYGSLTPQTTTPTAPPEPPTPPPSSPTYTPSELQINEPAPTAPEPTPSTLPEVAPMQYAPGGASLMIGGNATNLRRKYSPARLSGAASRGTSQFRISNTGLNSSLNIGV